jgi:hypothetical protein
MHAIQSALSSPRFNRLLFWLGAVVLAAGAAVLIVKLVGSDSGNPVNADPGFKAQLPEKSTTLTNASGEQVKTYAQLDPKVKATIRTFIASAVARKHLERSWDVIAPSMKAGYTYKSWSHAKALPIIPYPVDNVDKVNYHLEHATTKEIMVLVGVSAPPKAKIRPTVFRIALDRYGKGAQRRWLVSYWMPRWTPPINSYN